MTEGQHLLHHQNVHQKKYDSYLTCIYTDCETEWFKHQTWCMETHDNFKQLV